MWSLIKTRRKRSKRREKIGERGTEKERLEAKGDALETGQLDTQSWCGREGDETHNYTALAIKAISMCWICSTFPTIRSWEVSIQKKDHVHKLLRIIIFFFWLIIRTVHRRRWNFELCTEMLTNCLNYILYF